MATSNAERQAKWRAARAGQGGTTGGEKQLNVWISAEAKAKLAALAASAKLTERAMVERLITDADEVITKPSSSDQRVT